MDSTTRAKLSVMMFLQYFIWGSWYVIMASFLTSKGFTDSQIGLAYGTTAIGAMVSPFFVGMIADRFFPAQRVLAALHLIGGVLLYLASQQESFSGFYSLLLAHTILYMPTLALANSISFNQMSDTGKQFPSIRVFGTFGWIAQGFILAELDVAGTPTPFYIGAGVAIALGVFCLTLPHTPPANPGQKVTISDVLGLDALSLFKSRSFAVFVISSMLVCIPLSFYFTWTERMLGEFGVEKTTRVMTFGQISELFFLLLMPFFFRRLGVKYMIIVGIATWIARYVLFANGDGDSFVWMLYAGVILHGICYDFFFVTGQIYVDKKATDAIRSKAQGLITFATLGVGMFIGTWVAGEVGGRHATPDAEIAHNWAKIWTFPAILSFILLIIFALLFNDKVKNPEPESANHDAIK